MNEILRISFYVVLRFIVKGDASAQKKINYIRFERVGSLSIGNLEEYSYYMSYHNMIHLGETPKKL